MTTNEFATCPACRAKPGELHQLGCDVERCSRCGQQLLSCAHYQVGTVQAPPDDERMPWIGEWPGAPECRDFGWWSKRNPDGRGYVPCGPDDPGAEEDLNRLPKEAVWDRRRKRWVPKQQLGGARFVLPWWHQDLTPGAKTLREMVDGLQRKLDELRQMQEQGVVLSEASDMAHGHAVLVTTEPAVANRFGFELEEGEGGAGAGQP
jgi:hypothetical protein